MTLGHLRVFIRVVAKLLQIECHLLNYFYKHKMLQSIESDPQ